jgi:hypothetical protein
VREVAARAAEHQIARSGWARDAQPGQAPKKLRTVNLTLVWFDQIDCRC